MSDEQPLLPTKTHVHVDNDGTTLKTEEQRKSGFRSKTDETDADNFFRELDEDVQEAQRDAERNRWKYIAAVAGLVVMSFGFVVWYVIYLRNMKAG